MNKDLRCIETQRSRLIFSEDGKQSWVSPIVSMRNKPNNEGVKFTYGKRAGTLKPFKHKDFYK